MMSRLVNQALRNPSLRNSILDLEGGSDLDTLDLQVRGHFRYRPENLEVIRTPELMWSDWMRQGWFEGDCDDVSVMFATILKALLYPVRFVAIRYDNHPEFEHVFIEAYDGTSWRVFDPTVTVGTDYKATERMVESV